VTKVCFLLNRVTLLSTRTELNIHTVCLDIFSRYSTKDSFSLTDGRRLLMPVILAIWEAENNRLMVQNQPGESLENAS
jgi:hypothetical protein